MTLNSNVTVACVNFSPILGNKQATLDKMKHFITEASGKGANIIVFPETALTGYVFPIEETARLSETIPGPSTEEIAVLANQADVYVVFGMIETDKTNPNVHYNSAAVVGPEGILGSYRKVHPAVWEQRWCRKGSKFPTFKTRYGLIGIGICYDDYCFPEVVRAYALKGVRLLLHPTAFPEFADVAAKDYRDFYKTMLGARSVENQIFIASANLVGTEGNLTFIGYNPGTFSSGIFRMQKKWFKILYQIAAPFMRSAELVASRLTEILQQENIINGAIYSHRKSFSQTGIYNSDRHNEFLKVCDGMIIPFLND